MLSLRRHLGAEIVRSLGPASAYSIAPSFGIRQPRMSELSRGVVDRCSIEWLIRRIHRMGGSVSITVTLGDAGRQWSIERFRRTAERRLARVDERP
ncbi:MAG: helix-turn-helix domain-containing protein [Gemmatimonadota bacterium]|nr:helix-turn-helix domain-containing protein [Gemmatimonadota bacterium]